MGHAELRSVHEQPFHDLVAAARHGAYAIHAAWSDAHPGHIALRGFCACGYGSIPGVAGVVPLCTALARIPAEFEERRQIDWNGPRRRQRITIVSTPWEDASENPRGATP